MKEVRRKEAEDGSFILVYLGDSQTDFTLELTWIYATVATLQDFRRLRPTSVCVWRVFTEAWREHHREMGCINLRKSTWVYTLSRP